MDKFVHILTGFPGTKTLLAPDDSTLMKTFRALFPIEGYRAAFLNWWVVIH